MGDTATGDGGGGFRLPDLTRRMPQLDALRAFSVLFVLFAHHTELSEALHMPFGRIGVQTFFVISGFLITAILLRCKDYIDGGAQGVGFTLRQFYIRRTLRIFPVYYLFLGITFVAWQVRGIDAEYASLPWHLTYTSNFYMVHKAEWEMFFGHAWSLAVEEQFYLVWPLAVLFVPRRFIPVFLGLCLLIGLLSRGAIFALGQQVLGWTVERQIAAYALTPCNFDSLVLGAILAYMLFKGVDRRIVLGYIIACAAVGLALFGAIKFGPEALKGLFATTAIGCGATVAVFFFARGFGGPLGALFRSPLLVYPGTISYGIYLFHMVMTPEDWAALAPVAAVLDNPALPAWAADTALFLLNLAFVLALSALSWHIFEKPINDLKSRAPYRKRDIAAGAPAAHGKPPQDPPAPPSGSSDASART